MLSAKSMLRTSAVASRRLTNNSRHMASAVSSSSTFNFTVGDSQGIKVASRDDGRPTTSLSVVIRAGSRYEPSPGVASLLQKFAFQNTEKRTALRIVREAELIGARLDAQMTREHIVLSAQCLREDLAYFVELLGEVVSKTKYTTYALPEAVLPVAKIEYDNLVTHPPSIAQDLIHNVAFRRGLGNTLLAAPESPITASMIADFARQTYVRDNMAVIATGADASELQGLVGQYFADVPAGAKAQATETKYHGGEARFPFRSTTAHYCIAFPGVQAQPHPSVEQTVLAYILGGQSAIKWSAGQSRLAKLAAESNDSTKAFANSTSYNDAGLFSIYVQGPTRSIASAAKKTVDAVRSVAKGDVSKDDLTRAVAHAKYDLLEAAEERTLSAEKIGRALLLKGQAPDVDAQIQALDKVTVDQVAKIAKNMLDAQPSVVAVGETHLLPYYDEL